jgi:hypothetical protein
MQNTHLIFPRERCAQSYLRWRCGVLDRGAGWMCVSVNRAKRDEFFAADIAR